MHPGMIRRESEIQLGHREVAVMRNWIGMMVISLAVLGATRFSTAQSATVDGGAIDAGSRTEQCDHGAPADGARHPRPPE